MPHSAHLVKQHSDPLPPSQLTSSAPIIVQRQLGQPGHRQTTRVTLHHHPPRLPTYSSLDSALPMDSSYSPPTRLDIISRATPPSIRVVAAPLQSPPTPNLEKSPHLLMATDEPLASHLAHPMKEESAMDQAQQSQATTSRGANTPPILIVSGPVTGSLDYGSPVRPRDELQRSISTPQVCYW